jgi:hypothetical protein
MALVIQRARDLKRGALVEFTIDTVLLRVVQIHAVTTTRPITIILGAITRQLDSGLDRTVNVTADNTGVTDLGARGFAIPFKVQF